MTPTTPTKSPVDTIMKNKAVDILIEQISEWASENEGHIGFSNVDKKLLAILKANPEALSALSALSTQPAQPVMDSAWMTEGCRETWAAAGYNDKERAAERFRQGPYQAWACGWMESRAKLIGSGIYAKPSQTEGGDSIEMMANELMRGINEVEAGNQAQAAALLRVLRMRMMKAALPRQKGEPVTWVSECCEDRMFRKAGSNGRLTIEVCDNCCKECKSIPLYK
jgi:hypothetical protein